MLMIMKKLVKAINKIKKIDILVNNAGTNLPEPFLKVKKSSLETLLESIQNQLLI